MGLRPISTRFSARPPKQNSSSAELGTVAFCAMTGRSTSGNDSAVPAGLGARPRIRRGRVPSAAGAAARRRDAGDVSAHRRGAPTQQMPRGAGTQRAHGGCTAIAALLVVNDAQRHRLLLAPCARRASPLRATLLILGRAPSIGEESSGPLSWTWTSTWTWTWTCTEKGRFGKCCLWKA